MLMLLRVHCVCVKVQEVQSSRSPPPTSTTEQKTRPPPLHTRYPLVSTSIEDLFYCSLVRPRSRSLARSFTRTRAPARARARPCARARACTLARTFHAEAALFQTDLWVRPIFKVLRTERRGAKFADLRAYSLFLSSFSIPSPETHGEGDTLQLRKANAVQKGQPNW